MMSSSLITKHFQVHKTQRTKAKKTTDAPQRVHETETENEDLKVLKQFDLNHEYGPCIGITRMERWNRAEKHGLNPPQEVKKLIEENSENEEYELCLWKDYAL